MPLEATPTASHGSHSLGPFSNLAGVLQGMQSLSGGICSGQAINIPAAVLPIAPVTNFTVNFTNTAAFTTMPNLTTVAVSLNGTNTTLFDLPANGESFQARIGSFVFEGEAQPAGCCATTGHGW